MLLRRSKLLSDTKADLGEVKPEVCDLMLAVLDERGPEHRATLLKEVTAGGLLFGSMKPEAERIKLAAQCHAELGQHDEAIR
jgi:hypothetical protein